MVKLRSGTLTEPSTPIRKKAKANAGDTNMTATPHHFAPIHFRFHWLEGVNLHLV